MTTDHPLSDLVAPRPALYSIDAGRPFLPALVAQIVRLYEGKAHLLPDLTIFVPNKRAARTLAFCFADRAAEAAMLLPRIRALGDVDEEDLLFTGGPSEEMADLPPSADALYRQMQLARFVTAYRAAAHETQVSLAMALRASDTLSQLIDNFHREGVPLEALSTFSDDAMVEDIAFHWQQQLQFLRIVTDHWPAHLAEQGELDAAYRRHQMMKRLAEALVQGDPARPVLVAGSLGTAGATADLLREVAMMPQGAVILPALDAGMEERAWQAADASHPQAGFKKLLSRYFDAQYTDLIRPWGRSSATDTLAARQRLLSLSLRPAGVTDDWYKSFEQLDAAGDLKAACEGLSIAIAGSENEEAEFLALTIREALDVPGKTIMLVTPDRNLARRVCEKLKAWGVEVDDTGGVPLPGTLRGSYLRALALWAEAPNDPVRLTALLGHGLSGFGMSAKQAESCRVAIDRALRGPRRWPTPADLFAEIRAIELEDLQDDLATLTAILADCLDGFASADTIGGKLNSLLQSAEKLAATADAPGPERLWRYEDGEALAAKVEQILSVCKDDPMPEGEPFADLLFSLLSGTMVRKMGGHPRLSVLGLVESRLQHADLILLGGLNEGVWPGRPTEDAFLARRVATALNLPVPEELIGREAHDFSTLANSREVLLTYAEKRDREPASPSRWIIRLKSLLDAGGYWSGIDRSAELKAFIAARHEREEVAPAVAPRPIPPKALLPEMLSVSDIGMLTRDPYTVYARKVLGLYVLDPVGVDMGPRERGILIHDLLAKVVEAYPAELPDDLEARAAALAQELCDAAPVDEVNRPFWEKRILASASFLVRFEEEVRQSARPWLWEEEGRWSVPLGEQSVTIRGTPDRIDLDSRGALSIYDFKSGKVPTIAQDKTFDPQLSLLALMAMEGVFRDEARAVDRIAYVETLRKEHEPVLGSTRGANAKISEGQELEEHLLVVRDRITKLLKDVYLNARAFPSQPFPERINTYGDYDHLARRAEWAAGDGDD